MVRALTWSLLALACGCTRAIGEPLPRVPAGAAPVGVTGVEAGDWSQWADAKLVLALHEPIFYAGSEDESHARLLAFEDGRVLHRVADEDGQWRWYVTTSSRAEIDALRRSIARELSGTPQRFSCLDATHQRRSIILVRTGARWRVREGYALHACLPDVAEDFVPSSSHADPLPAPDHVPAGFVRAYRRLHAMADTAGERAWYSPKLELLWVPDTGEYFEPRVGEPWPADLPAPPAITWDDGMVVQPVDARFDEHVRAQLGAGALVQIPGGRYMVQVGRQQPGDATLDCAWNRPWRSCRRAPPQ